MPPAEATLPTQELPIHEPRFQPPRSQPRFQALAAAVRAHRVVTRNAAVPMRPNDHALYRRLAEIEGSPRVPGNGSAS